MTNRAQILKQQLSQSLGSPWASLLPESRMSELLAETGVQYRDRLYSPWVVVWMMLVQVLEPDKSLRNAVSKAIAWLSASGSAPPSMDTGGYSKARQRLPEELLQQLIGETGSGLEPQSPKAWQWCGRRVGACDGTTVLMSDSPANQAVYPQHGNQAAGCGFPIAKLCVIFSLTTGAVLMACFADWSVSEIVMSRQLYEMLEPGDVLLADQAYGSYVDLALVQQAGADGVFRKHHARQVDFRRGKQSGPRDHQVVWTKPVQRPTHMKPADFEALPDTLTVREVCLRIPKRGWRAEPVIVVTTLLDTKRYSAEALTDLYGRRWQATEINLRSLKTLLQMEMLRAKTPEMVRKELWSHLLAYNLIRSLMLQAAKTTEHSPFRCSFQGTRQLFNQVIPLLRLARKVDRRRAYQALLESIVSVLLPIRPNRQEPRVVKRRPKPFPRMRQPRSVLKARLVS
jgi:Transposase DDE domain/Insertion element 4 transposase N-terminal